MIRIQDAFRFAKLKIFQHKVRNLLSVLAVAMGLTIMLVILLGSTGVLNFGARMFKDSLAGRYFVREDLIGADVHAAAAQYKEAAKDYRPTDSWLAYQSSDWFSLGGIEAARQIQAKAFDPLFVQDFLFEGASFERRTDGVVPAIVSRDWLVSSESDQNMYALTSQERYELTQRVAAEAQGRQMLLRRHRVHADADLYRVEAEGEDTGITIEIVGLSSYGIGDAFGVGMDDIVLPVWALEDDRVADLFARPDAATDSVPVMASIIVEFANQDDRNAFAVAGMERYRDRMGGGMLLDGVGEVDALVTMPQPVIGRFEMFEAIVLVARRVAFGVGGFLLFIAMCFILINLSKAVADSRKEIGVFRAVGARGGDVRRIFYGFAFLVVNAGFVLALVLACTANAVASLRWGDVIFYEMASMGTSPVLDIPKFLLLRFDIPALLALHAVVLGCAFLAAAIPAAQASKIDPVIALKD